MDLAHALSGFLVGILVGVTGVGGGSLMAPILILVFGVAPATAVGTDLLFAAATKTVGGLIHHANNSADLTVVRRLAYGSIPATIITLIILHAMNWSQIKHGLLPVGLGAVLVVTALATLARPSLHRWILRHGTGEGAIKWQLPLTIIAGSILGILVTLTSIGAGALGATLLVFLYPLRLSTKQIVGTDILHAIPLTLLGGIGYFLIGSVDGTLLLNLLIGSIPGIIIGSFLVQKVSEKLVRIALSAILVLTGARLIFS
jgi:uncharacterized membrane protein YfcA